MPFVVLALVFVFVLVFVLVLCPSSSPHLMLTTFILDINIGLLYVVVHILIMYVYFK